MFFLSLHNKYPTLDALNLILTSFFDGSGIKVNTYSQAKVKEEEDVEGHVDL